MRREFSKQVKRDAFLRANGRCEECTAALRVGHFHYDHIIPDGLGGEPTLDNCKVLCTACHSAKTTKRDIPAVAKMKRQHDRHIGAKAPSTRSLPCSRKSPWKKKLTGEVVPRR